jgi:hypothetical protein
MAAKRYDIVIEQGATFQLSIVYRDGPDDSADPVDLTGASARMQARKRHGTSNPILDIAPTIADPGALGRIDITLSAATTSALHAGQGVYDLEVEYPDGTVERLIEGEISIRPEVTR